MTEIAKTLPTGLRGTFWRSLQTFSVTRVVIAMVLLIYLSVSAKKEFDLAERFSYWEICLAYLLLAAGFVLLALYYRRHFFLHLLSQITVDISILSVLYVAAGGAKSGLAILYLFPLAGGAILAPLVLAYFFVSVVTMVLLAESGYQILHFTADASFAPAGFYGTAFFSAVFVLNRLAAKLIKQEDLAAQRGRDLRIQEAINRLVIADMGDGILVVGRGSEIFAANPAAERMLGLSIPYDQPHSKLTDVPALIPISEAFLAWTVRHSDSDSMVGDTSTFVQVKPGSDTTRQEAITIWGERLDLAARLKLRFATVEATGLMEERTVIFMQDVTEIENRAQELKLASMGRLTASIAHEVRNPLSAIAHAASLLNEEAPNPTQTRLLKIVGDNVARLNQMIEDILKLSRKAQSYAEPLALAPIFTEILGEFQETHALPPGLIQLGEMDKHCVWFDPLHLREVVVNLLSNALRYASGRSGSISIQVVSAIANRLELHVQDDGPAITPQVRAHLFEPFYTTSSKGTGLGLYVARELCLNNGAMLDYEYRIDSTGDGLEQASGRFVITFSTPNPV